MHATASAPSITSPLDAAAPAVEARDLVKTYGKTGAGLLLGGVIAFFWVGSVASLLPGISFRLPVGATLVVVAVAVILGVVASILPARRAGRLDVIDALNYE